MRAKSTGLGGARRILVYGVTGSGKTTLAARLSHITGIGWTEVDTLTWLPGWVQRPLEEQRARITELCSQESWILDSAYGTWTDVVLPRTELVVGLDHARWRSLGRLVRRTVARTINAQEICNGNVETWSGTFSQDSIIRWHFRSFRRKHERLVAWEAAPGPPAVLRLRTPAAVEGWLGTVEREHERSA